MARQRAMETEENPIQTFQPRKYVCSRWPFLHLGGGVKFDKGYFTAENEEQAKRVERADGFGASILRIRDKVKNESVEQSAELLAEEELKKMTQVARRGMIGTRSVG